MAQDTTTLTIDIVSVLKGLDKTLRGLNAIKKSLQAVTNVRAQSQATTNLNKAAAATERLRVQQQRAEVTSKRLAQAQQQVSIRAQQLANAQTRADQTTQRLANAQQRLNAATATTNVRLGQQADAHVRAFRTIETATKRTQQTIANVGNALRGIGQGLASVGATLTVSLTPPLVALGAASVNAAVQLDSLKRGLTAIVGSSDEASRQLARLTQIAKLPGIGFQEAIQGSIRLQAVGFSAAEAEKNLREFSNAIALTGGGRDELTRVTVQLGQLAAKGKVLSQDLRPIIEAAPAVGRALLQAFGTVNADDIQELGLSTKQFLDILVGELGRLPRAAAGAKNSFENFRDELFRAGAVIGESVLPALTRLIEVVGPVVSGLARAFSTLPAPLQVVVVGFGALLAALGPVAFIVGQLVLAAGRLTVGLVQLNVVGILPTISNLKSLAAATATAVTAQRTLGVSTLALTGGLAAVGTAIAAIVTAFVVYKAFQKDSITLSKEQADALTEQIKGLKEQQKFIDSLGVGVKRTTDEQERLLEIYNRLNVEAQIRVAGITDEEKRTQALRAELQKLIELRGQERIQQAASAAAQIANSEAIVIANNRSRDSIAQRIAANNLLVETLEREGRITLETGRQLERLGITAGGDVRQAILALQTESTRLVRRQKELGDNTEKTRQELNDYLAVLRTLDPNQQLTARQLLTLAKNMGLFRGDVEQTIPVLEDYIKRTDEAAKASERLNRALSPVAQSLLKSGEAAEKSAKARRELIQAAAAEARELAVDFAGAQREIRRTVAIVPELRRALERESELTGKSMEELLREALESAFKGRDKDKSGTALRNAQLQLQRSLAESALASAEERATIERLANERLLQINENAFRLQLRSYREYLNERARLTNDNINLEIAAQRQIVTDALAEAERLRARSQQKGIPQAERVKAEAGAAEADERATKARIKLLELDQQRRDLVTEVSQLLAEPARQQIIDTQKLEQEWAELRGSIEAAVNAATDERFREELQRLSKEQAFLNKLENTFIDSLSREEKEDLKVAKARNQRQIEAILGIQGQENALASLAAAQELVRRATEKQQQLEQQLTFEVEFRGLSEEDAIARRLAGERKLNDSLTIAHETIRQIVAALQARGVEPPRALIEFLDQLRTQVQGLGELSFSEQFRIAQQQFDLINEQRLRQISDIERAVRTGNLSEAEGVIAIERANRSLVGELERRLAVLKEIAIESGDLGLQQQVRDLEDALKDANEQVADFGRQIESASKDAFRSGFRDFFSDILSRTQSVKEALLGLAESFSRAISDVIAENLSKRLFESVFGGVDEASGGFLASLKRLFGLGGGPAVPTGEAVAHVGDAAQEHAVATVAATALTTAATTAAATLQAGATAAATTDATSAITFGAAITTAATAFAAAVIAAGTAFAAAVAGGSSGGVLGGLLGGEAATGLFPAVPGGAYKFVEGGYPEAVLTTDPRHAVRQVAILREYLRQTRGLFGRVPEFASGGIVSRETMEANVLSQIQRAPSSMTPVPAGALVGNGGLSALTLRQIFIDDQRDIGNWYNSAEGDRTQIQWLHRNRMTVRRMLGVRG